MNLLLLIFFLLLLIALSILIFVRSPVFGSVPKGNSLQRILHSPNYRHGSFQNISTTPMKVEGVSYWKILKDFYKKNDKAIPSKPIKTAKRELRTENSENPIITWFGHSSYLIQYKKFSLLVDPVFGLSPSPIQGMGPKSFEGSRIYNAHDLPKIDAVLITHDHYDHLDYQCIKHLKDKVDHFYTSLGVGSHLERWGIKPENITELDWWEESILPLNIKLIATPARHFSGRGFRRFKTLWSGFVLASDQWKVYLGGDSGYDSHFKTIGDKFGSFDLALLECGQYSVNWPLIHMMPEETVQAALDLNAKVLMPVHWGKFKLSTHSWTEPIERVMVAAERKGLKLTTPMIGEKVIVNELYPSSKRWEESN